MNYDETVDYILNIPRFAKKIGTENLAGLLCRLGNPQDKIKSIHIAGTNGKGSTAKMLAELLAEAGYNVGLFTSPHLVSINERIKYNGEAISNEDFVWAFEKVREKFEVHPSFFELIFAMATVYYEKRKPDYVIYETGMGGRLDATNVLKPELSVITSIGMDHMEYLGSSLSQIATEKAGIIKSHVPVVYLKNDKITSEIIEETAQIKKSPFTAVEKSQYIINEIGDKSIDFSFHNRYYSYDNLKIKRTSIYQIENACLAVTAFDVLSENVPKGNRLHIDIIKAGLSDFSWEGRMEEIMPDVYVDGAHNEAAIKSYCETLTMLHGDRSKILVFAAVSDKRYEDMIKELTGKITFDRIIVTSVDSYRKAPILELAEIFKKCTGFLPDVFDNIPDAMDQALKYQKQITKSAVYCVGSLYLVGDIKRWKQTKDNDSIRKGNGGIL